MHQVLDGSTLAKVDGWVVGLVIGKDAVHFGGEGGHELVMKKVNHGEQPKFGSHGLIPEDVHEVVPSD